MRILAEKGGKKETKRDDLLKKKIGHGSFHPFSLGDQPLEELNDKKVEKMVTEAKEKFLDSLKIINEEILPLSDL